MSMIGQYITVEDSVLQQIIHGDKDIYDIIFNPCINIEKSWDAIHYILCKDRFYGKAPMKYIVPKDNVIDCDLDYGASYITVEQVKEASDFLNSLDDNTLKEMYDFKALQRNKVYPLTDLDKEDDFYEYIYFYLMILKKYFAETAQQGKAIIFFIW